MSQRNAEIVRRMIEYFQAMGDLPEEMLAPDFVWDMSTFGGWPEEQLYEGVEGARRFIRAWTDPFLEYVLELEAVYDQGEKVVAVLRQRGRSQATGLVISDTFAEVFMFRDGKVARMEGYHDPAEALRAAGMLHG